MKFNYIKLVNFGNIKHFEKTFDKPLLILSGDNGNGKSTVIKGIRLAVFDSYDGVLQDYVNWDAKEFYVEVGFNHKAVDYKTTVRYDGSTERELSFGTETYSGDEAKRKLKEILDPTLLKAAMLSLEQETDIVKAKPAERRDHLKKIYNLDFKQALAGIDADLKEHSLEVARLTSTVEGIEHKTYLEPTKPVEPFSAEEKTSIENELKADEDKITGLKKLAEDAQSNREQYQKLLDEQTSLSSKKEVEKQSLDAQKEKISKLPEDEQAEKILLEKQLKDCEQDKARIEGELGEQIKQKQTELTTAKSSMKRVGVFDENAYTNLKAEISTLENKLSDLRNATDICPTCGQAINSPEHIAKRDEEIKLLSQQLEEKRKDFDAKAASKKVYDEATEHNQKTKELCSSLELQIATLTSTKEKALMTCESNLKSTQTEIEVLAEKFAAQKSHLEEMVTAINKNISQIEENETKVNASIEELKPKLSSVDYSAEIAQLSARITEEKGQLARYADYLSQLSLYKDTMAKVEQQKKEDAEQLVNVKQSLQDEAKAVKDCEVEAKTLKTDFPVYVISRVVKDLESRMNEFLKKTYGGRYTVKMKDKGNALHIVYGPKGQDVALSSGYERSLFNLAFKISISKAIRNKCLVLDEADSAASPRNAKLFYQVLAQTVGHYFEQIILVSHKDEVKEMLENDYKAEVITFVSGVAQ